MFRGIYTALSGMDVQQARLDIITNNLANVHNNGYKREQLLSKSFGEYLLGYQSPNSQGIKPIGKINMGTAVSQVVTSMQQGQLVSTSKPTDLALDGKGFFVVKTASGEGDQRELYTRESSFTVDSAGYLVTSQGDRLQGASGDIKVGSDQFTVLEDGTVKVGGRTIDTLRVVEFADPGKLKKEGNEYFSATDEAEMKGEDEAATRVRQGFVEKSNVDVVKEITDLISILRTYEANSKLLEAQDKLLGKAVNEVGRLR
ncbi:MAG: flagellar hook-basal body complex protein [Desulfotomaculum sp.]|nr:flagellar hook-basal body complex protein [Desulfotomaculum sp.]